MPRGFRPKAKAPIPKSPTGLTGQGGKPMVAPKMSIAKIDFTKAFSSGGLVKGSPKPKGGPLRGRLNRAAGKTFFGSKFSK